MMATAATRTLFQISDDLHALAELLDESEGVIDNDLADAAVDQFLAELGAETDRKVDNYCALIKELEAKSKVFAGPCGTDSRRRGERRNGNPSLQAAP
jgi:hypothetical protein